MSEIRRVTGLAVILGAMDFERYAQAEPVQVGPLAVTRWYPAWWGISPWASPFWRVTRR